MREVDVQLLLEALAAAVAARPKPVKVAVAKIGIAVNRILDVLTVLDIFEA